MLDKIKNSHYILLEYRIIVSVTVPAEHCPDCADLITDV